MGTMLSATCPCGYDPGEFLVGGGMQDFTTRCSLPALCRKCRQLLIVNYLAGDPRCPSCDEPVTFYTDESLRRGDGEGSPVFDWSLDDEQLVIPNTTYLCPSCGEKRLRFADVGCWD